MGQPRLATGCLDPIVHGLVPWEEASFMRRSSLPRAPEPDVRVRVRRRIVQIGSERAGVRAVGPVVPPKQRATALPRLLVAHQMQS